MKFRRALVRMSSSAFFVGDIPIASGAFGSLVGFFFAWYGEANPFYAVLLLALCLWGCFICRESTQIYGTPDPRQFVLDEVCGMMLSCLWLPRTMSIFIAAYVIFRILDVWKPWPISMIQRSKNPVSIMGDDLAAGLATNLILQVVLFFFFSGTR